MGFIWILTREPGLRWSKLCDMVCWGHKETDMVSNNSQTGCGVQSMLNCYEGTKKISPSTLQHQQPEHLIQPMTDPCFHVVTPTSHPDHLTGTAEIATCETSQCFLNLLLSSFVETLNHSLTFLLMADRSGPPVWRPAAVVHLH